MSTIKSSDEHLTINADGSGKEVKIQRDGTEVLATTSSGVDISGSVSDTDGNVRSGRKNLIINGGFDVWQRGTSAVLFNDYATADRWKQVTFGAVSKVNVDDRDCLKLVASPTNVSNYIRQYVEDFGQLKGKTLTFSFDMKASIPTQYRCDFWLQDNSNTYIVYGTNTSGVTQFNDNITTSWGRYSVSITVPASYTVKTTDAKLEVNLGLANGAATGVECYIDNVQLEVGSVATDFEQRSYGEELALCQRYYTVAPYYTEASKVNSVFGHAKTNSRYTWVVTQFPVQMRIVPTVNLISGAGGNGSTTTDGKARYVETYGGAGGSDLVPYSLGPSHKDSFCIKTYNEHDSGAWYGIQAGYTADAEL